MGGGVACSGFPFFHQAGLYLGLITMSMSYTQCLIPDPRNTGHVCKEISKYRPSIMLHVPSLYQMLMDNPAFRKLISRLVRFVFPVQRRFRKRPSRPWKRSWVKGKLVEILRHD